MPSFNMPPQWKLPGSSHSSTPWCCGGCCSAIHGAICLGVNKNEPKTHCDGYTLENYMYCIVWVYIYLHEWLIFSGKLVVQYTIYP